MNDILTRLAAPFAAAEVDWRVGSMNQQKTKGMALAYIDARTVQDRLDAVCGALWACEHVVSAGTRVTCKISLKIGDEWISRSDGAGETDVEGEKGSYSDSFKRAAVRWGVGRYLYDLASPWVDVDPMGKSYKIRDGEKAKLNALVERVAKQANAPQQPAPTPSVNSPTGVDATEINRLIYMGDEAASRGRDALGAFGRGRSRAELAAFGRKRIADWETRADEIDRMTANDPALQEAVS